MWFSIIATVITGALLYKLFLSGSKEYWKQYGIREIDISPVVGKLDLLLGRKSMSEGDAYAYSLLDPSEKFCGLMEMGSQPMVLVKDLELLKKILIKDFDHFVDRRQVFAEEDRSLNKMLLSLHGDEWKSVRTSVSPTFTTGKIKKMMGYFNEVGKDWVGEFTHKANSSSNGSTVINVMSSVNLYTLEVISTTVFGMNASVIKNPESAFVKMANRFSEISIATLIKFAIRMSFPRFSKFFKFAIADLEALTFFERILEQGLKSRLKGETKRNDFLQLLVEAKNGELEATLPDELDSFEKDATISTEPQKKQYLTEDIMNAQSVIFFFAGFSTTTNTIAFALYALALHPEIQDRLRQEVDKIVKEDGSLDYDDVGKLTYMDMVICEVLRKFPPFTRLERVCVKEYRDPEIGLVIPVGALVAVPLNGIHNDKQYYENPDKFDPEHFSPEKKPSRSPYAYMPFGMGPRNCLGMRFAQIEVKSAIAHMIHSFKIEPTAKTPKPIQGTFVGVQMILGA